MLKLIPFDPQWMTHETLDLHAVYRRPKRTFDGDLIRDEHGFIQWDVTTALPVRSHYKWVAKGFEYVTLAKTEDVINAADPELAQAGVTPLHNPQQYLDQARDRGPWDSQKYLDDMRESHRDRVEKLKDRITRMGPDGAEEFERERDPEYVLPASLNKLVSDMTPPKRKPGRPKKHEEPVAVQA